MGGDVQRGATVKLSIKSDVKTARGLVVSTPGISSSENGQKKKRSCTRAAPFETGKGRKRLERLTLLCFDRAPFAKPPSLAFKYGILRRTVRTDHFTPLTPL